tara:strand:+ start:129 stop:626 length:498 start_codon:yes stop_codon:yes gene_type:complete
MWCVIKFDQKNLNLFKHEISKKLGFETVFYYPKCSVKIKSKFKTYSKDINLLNDYIFVFNRNFNSSSVIESLKFVKGLKYILSGFLNCQDELNKFIKKCKDSEDHNGYLTSNFFDLILNVNYKFKTGLLTGEIFKIISFNKRKMNIMLGHIKTTINKDKFLINPV